MSGAVLFSPVRRPLTFRWTAVLVLAAALLLSALHGAVPHPQGQATCLACHTLASPAVLQPAQASLSLPQPQTFVAPRPSQPALESSAPKLRPLRAPPLNKTV